MGAQGLDEDSSTRFVKIITIKVIKCLIGVGVAVLNKFVYAVGGSNGGTPWDSVERYNPANDTWTRLVVFILSDYD